jgi:hypothetical protein
MALKQIFKGRKVSTVRPTDFSQTLLGAGDWNYNLMEQIEAELALKAPAADPIFTGTVKLVNLITSGAGTVTFDPATAFECKSTVIKMAGLPLADPGNSGQLWNNGGVVTVSP